MIICQQYNKRKDLHGLFYSLFPLHHMRRILDMGPASMFTLVFGYCCLFSITSAIPCSPCDIDSDCLSFLEYCQLPDDLIEIPDFLLNAKKLHKEDKSRERYET